MITNVEYMQIVNEYYDLSDYNTKKKVLFCNEATKTSNIEHITNNLYLQIKNDITAIDFGSIPRSKGVISRIDNYQQLLDCINTIHDLILEYHEDTKLVDEISTAIANIQQRERQFTKAFALNIDFPMMIYNTITLACISSISLMISSCIEFIKNGHDSFSMSFDKAAYKKTRNHVLYQTIQQFNRTCLDGSLDKAFAACVKQNLSESVIAVDEGVGNFVKDLGKAALAGGGAKFLMTKGVELASGAGAAAIALKTAVIIVGAGFALVALVVLLRWFIYWAGKTSLKISDWFETQATLLQINAENLKYREDPKGDDHRKEVYQKQMKWVERFRKISNKLLLVDSKASKETDRAADDDKRSHKYEDDSDSDDGLF